MLPMLALFHLLNELPAHELGAPSHASVSFGAQVKALHEIVRPSRYRVFEPAVKLRRADQTAKLLSRCRAAMDDWHREDAGTFEDFEPRGQVKEHLPLLVEDVELEEVVRQATVMHRMSRI